MIDSIAVPVGFQVLMVHIPLWNESFAESGVEGAWCGDPAAVNNPAQPNHGTPTTLEFVRTINASTHLLVVLAGHIHQAQGHRLRLGDTSAGAMLTTAATKHGGSRMLSFVPATPARL